MNANANAKARILERLRAARPSALPAPPDVAGWYTKHRQERTAADYIQQFRTAIEAAHATVHLVDDSWPELMHELLAARHITHLLTATDLPHGQALRKTLATTGIRCMPFAAAIDTWKEQLFTETPASLTLARGAIAETGTLILWPDAEEPRTMSLVPPVHFVLLDAADIHPTFHAAMQTEGWASQLPTNALLISGPSKTADIQQTLAYGAHGPKELIVLLQGATA